ncbi:Uncharacterised protein [Enterobacter hormaechei]|nr:Uncharacterised protein [Enterobacter hormaechei]
MRPKQRDPGDRRSDNRQQYGSGTHVFRPARQFMEFRPDSINYGLDSAIQNFHYHHQKDRSDEQYAGDSINIKEAGDDNGNDCGNRFLAESGFINPCRAETFP